MLYFSYVEKPLLNDIKKNLFQNNRTCLIFAKILTSAVSWNFIFTGDTITKLSDVHLVTLLSFAKQSVILRPVILHEAKNPRKGVVAWWRSITQGIKHIQTIWRPLAHPDLVLAVVVAVVWVEWTSPCAMLGSVSNREQGTDGRILKLYYHRVSRGRATGCGEGGFCVKSLGWDLISQQPFGAASCVSWGAA